MEEIYWSRVRSGPRRSRRSILRTAGALSAGLAAWAASGCSSGNNNNSPAATALRTSVATPARAASGGGTPGGNAATAAAAASPAGRVGGTLQVIDGSDPNFWDPDADPLPTSHLWDFIGESMLQAKENTFALGPGFVPAWEQPDPTTITLHMPKGAAFHELPPLNGRPATAADLKYSIERALNPDPRFWKKSRFTVIDHMDAQADSLVIHLKEPNAPLLTYLASQYVMAPEGAGSDGVVLTPENAVGTGPFMFKRGSYKAVSGGSMIRNTKWRGTSALMDGVAWTVIKDAGAQLAAYRTGNIDYGYASLGGIDGAARKQLESTNKDIIFAPAPQRWVNSLIFRHTDPQFPFKDLRFRRALDLASNRQEQLALVTQGAGTICGALSPDLLPTYAIAQQQLLALPGYRPDKTQDLQDAKAMLSAAGFPNGLTLPMTVATESVTLNRQPGEIAVSQLAKIGVKVNIAQQLDLQTYKTMQNQRTMTFYPSGTTAAPEPDDQLTVRYHSQSTLNRAAYSNPQVDALIEQQRKETDNAKRTALIMQVQKLIIDDVAYIHLFTENTNTVRQAWVKGLYSTPFLYYNNVAGAWLDKHS